MYPIKSGSGKGKPVTADDIVETSSCVFVSPEEKVQISANKKEILALRESKAYKVYVDDELNKKVDKVDGKQLSTEDYTSVEKEKLAGIAPNANKYVHPESHPATMITEDTLHRFVTDVLISAWNAKPTVSDVQALIQGVVDVAPAALDTLKEIAQSLNNDPNFAATMINALASKVDKIQGKQLSTEDYTTTEKTKLNGIATNANNYTHPTGDGSLHVPATGTTNSGKVLKAGATAGSVTWGSVAWSEITNKSTTLSGYGITDAVPSSDVATTAIANKILKLDGNSKLPASITGNADGNAATATKLQTSRTISATGDATGSTTFDGSANASIALTLANSGVTAGTYAKVTVDSKGRVTGGSAMSSTDVTAALGYTPVSTTGGTLTNFLTLHSDPTSNFHAVTKQYVDNVVSGLDVKKSVRATTTGNLAVASSTATTLTLSAALTTLDGVSLAVNDRILVKDQTVPAQNGLYVYTSSTILTRTTGTDSSTELTPGAFTFVEQGTTYADTGWVLTTDGTITLGTTNITWSQFSSAGVVTGDNTTIVKTGNTLGQKSGVVTAGTYAKVTVDTYGRVTGGSALTASDIPKEGNNASATGSYAHAEGSNTSASNLDAHAEGSRTTASGQSSHAEGSTTFASGDSSHAEGGLTAASGAYSHAEGLNTIANGRASHAEGGFTFATIGNGSAILACNDVNKTITVDNTTGFTSGFPITAVIKKLSGGIQTVTVTAADTVNKILTISTTSTIDSLWKAIVRESSAATNSFAHAEGSNTVASGDSSHAEGGLTYALGAFSHAEGMVTYATGSSSHAEGGYTTASGNYSHAEGYSTVASSINSHAEGYYTSTNNSSGAHIMGQFGDANASYSWFLANGTNIGAKGLAAKILSNGQMFADGAYASTGADYAEMFEWADGNPNSEDRVGHFVVFDEDSPDKIRIATKADSYVLGIVSANPTIIGDNAELHWKGRWLLDGWGRKQYHDVTVPAVIVEGMEVEPERVERQAIVNPEWNPDEEYIPREQRPEWSPIGLMGKLVVHDDGTCLPGKFCRPNNSGIATLSESGYYVMKRTGENQVMVLLK